MWNLNVFFPPKFVLILFVWFLLFFFLLLFFDLMDSQNQNEAQKIKPKQI